MTRKRDTSKKRQAILDAAIVAFAEKGFDNTSMDYVAEVANASKRTVYNHFASKEILYEQMLERFLEEVMALKQIDYSPEQPLDTQLASFADAKLAVTGNPQWLAITKISMGVFISNPDGAQRAMSTMAELENPVYTWLEAAKADGRLKIDNIELAAELFNSMISGALFWPVMLQGPMPEQQVQALKSELIATFLSRYQA